MRYHFWGNRVFPVRDGVTKAPPHSPPKPLPAGYPPGPRPFMVEIFKLLKQIGDAIDKHGVPRRTGDAMPAGLWDGLQYKALWMQNERLREFWRRR